jgi:hypothetical protein
MPKQSFLETLGLLLGLLPNYKPKSCPCHHCRYRYHRTRSAQIDTTSKRKIPQRAQPLGPLRTTRTYDQGRSPQYKSLVRQRDTLPLEKEEILVTRERLLTSKTTKKTLRRKSQSLPVKKIVRYHYREDLPKPRKGILYGEFSKLLSHIRGRIRQ